MIVNVNEKRRGKNLIIRNVHMQLRKGTTTLIIGTSGAGKSTLISCIIKDANKYVHFDDANPKIAYIQQHPAMNKDLTVRESIYYARRFEYLFEPSALIHKTVDEYIRLLGLTGRENNKIKNLSGGQQQRVAIARELIRDADILIADEIDTGLDCGVAKSLAEILARITREKNIITLIISHNVINIPLYDKVVVLAKDSELVGGVAYNGNPAQIRSYFNVPEYCDILTRINTKEEGGEGLADEYIKIQNRRMR